MSEPQRKSKPSSDGADRTDALRLADTGNDATPPTGRLPVPPSGKEKGGAGSASPAGSFLGGADSAQESGRGTAGFETLLGKLVVERGLATGEELDHCRTLAQNSSSAGTPSMLADVLVEREFLTRRQLDRLRNEFEADRGSQKIPGYRILKKLGSGAMATVFLGKQLSLDRMVAIKVLPKKFSANSKFIERFIQEGRAAAKLNDPNIVQAYDVGQAGEHHYFVMEYVDGETVYDRIVQKKRFSEKEAIEVVRQVASALRHAHERGFIHRDIKPKNIMMSSSSTVKLADLGLARALSDKEAAEAESGRAYGTPYYISPEQIRGQVDIGPPADLYGLGATFYHMVTGRVPFEGKNPSEVMHRHLKSKLVPPDHLNPKLSSATAQVIEMMLAKDPRDRYQRAEDLLTDLDLLRRGQAPHFAQSNLDLTSVVTDLRTAPAIADPSPPMTSTSAKHAADRTLVLVLAVVLAGSLLANLALGLLVLTR